MLNFGRLIGVMFALVCAGWSIGCTSNGDTSRPSLNSSSSHVTLHPIDPVGLAGDLRRSLDTWTTRIIGLTSQITAETDSRIVREACLRLKIRSATAARLLATQTDPRAAFLEAWIMAIQFRHNHEQGPDRQLFGAHQQLIVDAAVQAQQGVEDLGRRHFSPEQINAAKPEIVALAEREVLSARYMSDRVSLTRISAPEFSQSGAIARMLKAPLSPFSSLQGVADTPQAIEHVAMSVAEFGQVLESLPELTRWHTELLMYDANELPVVVDARNDFERLSLAFQQLAAKVDTLPDDMRIELAALLRESDASQAKMQTTLVEARKTIDSLTAALDKATTLSENVAASTQQIHALMGDRASDATAAQPGQGLSVEQVTATIDRANTLAVELRGLLSQLHQPLPAGNAMAQTLDDAQRKLDASIDKLTWRGVILIAVALAAAVVYRLIPRRGT